MNCPSKIKSGLSYQIIAVAGVFWVSIFLAGCTSNTLGTQQQLDRTTLGEDLLFAAQKKNWSEVKRLLSLGADPNIIILPERLVEWFRRRNFAQPSVLNVAAREGKIDIARLLIRAGADLEGKTIDGSGETPLMEAVSNRQLRMAEYLVSQGANISRRSISGQSATDRAWTCGDEAIIRMFQKLAKLPVGKRHLPEVPYSAGARTKVPSLVPGTAGAVPLHCPLWISDHELLVLHESPRRFSVVNIRTGLQKKLEGISRRWAEQSAFDSKILTVSPDGKWLLGFAGTSNNPTWLATALDENTERVWPRDTRAETGYASDRQPPVIWIDSTHWIEVRRGEPPFVRIRSLNHNNVEKLPLIVTDHLDSHDSFCITISGLGPAHRCGSVGIRQLTTEEYVARLLQMTDTQDGWRIDCRRVVLPQSKYSGSFMTSHFAVSPQYDRIAWLNYFTASEAKAIILSDIHGEKMRVIYQHLYKSHEYERGRAESPRYINWTPTGDALTYWQGEYGENGLWILQLK